jgi:hypothetical protein
MTGATVAWSRGGTWLARSAAGRDGMSEESCLHCEINEIVREHIGRAGDDPVICLGWLRR